ncbi:MAG: AbiV family abortive infection protein [Candidatus Bathyarchaeia archaeon]
MKNEIDFRKGYDLCMQHISQLTQDADLLAETGSFGHAIFLYHTAMEEAAKAFYYAGIHAKLFQHEEVRDDLKNHLYKTSFFFMMRLGQIVWELKNESIKIPTRDELIEGMKDFYESILEARSIRTACLYIDLKDNEWITPLEFDEEEFRTMKDCFATPVLKNVKSLAESFFEIPNGKQKEFRTMINGMIVLEGIAIVENLYKNGILKREEYEEIKSDIERRIEELKNKTNCH